jgi:hypothetical protein
VSDDVCPICGAVDHTCAPLGAAFDLEVKPRFVAPVPNEERTYVVPHDVIEVVPIPYPESRMERLVFSAGMHITQAEAADLRARGLLHDAPEPPSKARGPKGRFTKERA